MSVEPPDRATVVAAIMPDVLSIRLDVADDEVGLARLVSEAGGTCAGLFVAKELFARVGARTRPLVGEGRRSSARPRPWPRSAGRSPRSVVPRRSP